MAIAASAPVLPNQKKQCCKIAWFTDAPCISAVLTWRSEIFVYFLEMVVIDSMILCHANILYLQQNNAIKFLCSVDCAA
jgi:hypothetical protein